MKKIIVLLCLLLWIHRSNVHAQDFGDTVKTEKPKNEVNANLGPFLIYLLGGENEYQYYSFGYKRVLGNKNAFRASLAMARPVYVPAKDAYPIHGGFGFDYNDEYQLILQTDSEQIREYRRTERGNKIQLKLGYEWRRGSRRLTRFYGVDLCIGAYAERVFMADLFFYLDSTRGPAAQPGLNWVYTNGGLSFESDTRYCSFGFSPFYGLRYELNSKFLVSAQACVDASFAIGSNTTHDYSHGFHSSDLYTNFNIDMPGIINDVSLVYRF